MDENVLSAVERFSRISLELANERTLLSWMRTCFAAVRTVFTFFGITGSSTFWTASVLAAEISAALIVLLTAVWGHIRFTRMKQVITSKTPPLEFGRTSMNWVYVAVIILALTTTLGVVAQQWEEKH